MSFFQNIFIFSHQNYFSEKLEIEILDILHVKSMSSIIILHISISISADCKILFPEKSNFTFPIDTREKPVYIYKESQPDSPFIPSSETFSFLMR